MFGVPAYAEATARQAAFSAAPQLPCFVPLARSRGEVEAPPPLSCKMIAFRGR
jgi:hypothetical protein